MTRYNRRLGFGSRIELPRSFGAKSRARICQTQCRIRAAAEARRLGFGSRIPLPRSFGAKELAFLRLKVASAQARKLGGPGSNLVSSLGASERRVELAFLRLNSHPRSRGSSEARVRISYPVASELRSEESSPHFSDSRSHPRSRGSSEPRVRISYPASEPRRLRVDLHLRGLGVSQAEALVPISVASDSRRLRRGPDRRGLGLSEAEAWSRSPWPRSLGG